METKCLRLKAQTEPCINSLRHPKPKAKLELKAKYPEVTLNIDDSWTGDLAAVLVRVDTVAFEELLQLCSDALSWFRGGGCWGFGAQGFGLFRGGLQIQSFGFRDVGFEGSLLGCFVVFCQHLHKACFFRC